MKYIFILLALVCAATATSLSAGEDWPADVTHGPWLSHPGISRMSIGFTTTKGCGGGVAYREKGTEEWHEAWHSVSGQICKLTEQHIIHLNGLKADTEYEYRLLLFGPSPVVYFQAMTYENDMPEAQYRAKHIVTCENPEFHFRTLPEQPAEFTFALTSDLQQLSRSAKAQLLQDFTEKCGVKDSSFFVLLGDLEDNMRIFEYNYTQSVIDQLQKANCSRMPMVFARGNHEWRGVESPLWCEYFSSPVTNEPYYAFSSGEALFIVLDSGEDRPSVKFSYDFTGMNATEDEYIQAQADWLAGVVSSDAFKNAKYRIVMCHGGIFSQDESHIYDTIRKITRGAFTSDHPENRIHLWMAGHTHNYCRTIPGSKELYWIENSNTKVFSGDEYDFTVVTNDGPRNGGVDYSVLLVTVAPDKLTIQAKAQDGTLLDKFQVTPDGTVNDLNDDTLPAKKNPGNFF